MTDSQTSNTVPSVTVTPAGGERSGDSVYSLDKAVYNTFYFAAYGVTFFALALGKLLPWNSAAYDGLRDGAVAASAAMKTAEDRSEQSPRNTNIDLTGTTVAGGAPI